MNNNLEWTGERLVTDIEGVLGVAEHLHRYALAAEYVLDKTVLDIASGEGYGSHILSMKAKQVTGVDISADAVKHSNAKYTPNNPNLNYLEGSASSIPLADSSVDIITSFETLEHTTQQDEFFTEIKRVLKPGGLLIMSTPDTVPYKKREPVNPYHLKELTTDEFIQLTGRYFKHHQMMQQRCLVGSCLIPSNTTGISGFTVFHGNFESVNKGYGNDELYGPAFFNLVFASDTDSFIKDKNTVTFFNHVPEMLNEFRGSRGLMFELQETKKLADRLLEIEKSKSYRLAQFFSKIFNAFR